MIPLLRMARRSLLRRWPQTLLSVTGIGLGIAVMLAIDISNDSARRAFEYASESMGGEPEAVLLGGAGGIDEEFYRDLRLRHGIRGITPVVEGRAKHPASDTELRVIGIDPLSMGGWSGVESGGGWSTLAQMVARPDAVMMTADTLRDLGVGVPGRLPLRVGDRLTDLAIIGELRPTHRTRAEAMRKVALMDIGGAQAVLGMPGRLSRIDVHDEGETQRLAALLPPSVRLVPGSSRARTMRQMTQSFRINLTALSLLAVVIGAFLIYGTMVTSVLQRREQIATLRTLGAGRWQIVGAVMAEALLLAAGGMALGTALGSWLSHALLHHVTRTINDLYFSLQLTSPVIGIWTLAKANVLGLLATLGAAAAPAWEASRVAPRLAFSRSHLESQAARWLDRWAIAGLAAWSMAVVILWASERSILAGFASLFCLVAGFALTIPLAMAWLMRLMRRLLARSAYGRMAVGGILASLSRTHVAVTALAVALSATVGVGIMISSFRTSVSSWLNHYLRADIYLSQESGSTRGGIDREVIEALRGLPEVRTLTSGRWIRIMLADGVVRLYVVDTDRRGFRNFQLSEPDEAWRGFDKHGAVIVSESFAYHRDLSTGDTLSLPTLSGPKPFHVAGIFRDYSSDQGTVVMQRRHYRTHWDDPAVDSLALYLRPGADPQALLTHLGPTLRAAALRARSNRALRELSLEVFDRTFAVTRVLRLLTIVIAAVAIISALAAIQLERAREFAVLRATGVTRRGMAGLLMGEGFLMGVAAGILSLPLGLSMSMVLVRVINRRSFGWSIDMAVNPEHLLTALALGGIAGLMAAVFPALRMTAAPPASGLRYE